MWKAATVHLLMGVAVHTASASEIRGTVRDPHSLAVRDARVTVAGPQTIGGLTSTTDVDGSFRFRRLPPGDYTVRVEKDGFRPAERPAAKVRTGGTIVLDFKLEAGTVTEDIVVIADVEGLDRRTNQISATFAADSIHGVPSSTDLWGVLAQSPGVRMRGYDVGGSHKATQRRYESFGIRSQNRVVSDGVDATEGTGDAGMYYDFYAVEEFQVSAAGADVTMTSPGASIVMTTKSGGEELSGLMHLDVQDHWMVGDNVDAELRERGFSGNPNLLLWEGHADLGGQLLSEKLWFYGAYNHFRLDKARLGVDPSFATEDTRFDNFTAKIAAALSERDRLIGYSQWGKKVRLNIGLSSRTPLDATRDQDSWAWVHKLEWQRSWSERLFGTVRLAHFGQLGDLLPKADPAVSPRRFDRSTRVNSGSPGTLQIRRYKPQLTMELDYYLPDTAGSHDFKFGFTWLYDQLLRNDSQFSVLYLDDSRLGRPNDVSQIRFSNTPLDRDIVNRRLDFYVQDRWTPTERIAVTAGARITSQRVFHNDVQLEPAVSGFFESGSVQGRDLARWLDVAPRLGTVVSLDDGARTVLRASFGRYIVNLADTFFGANSASLSNQTYPFLDQNQNGLYDGPGELGELAFSFARRPDAFNQDLPTSYSDEVAFSVERMFSPSLSGRMSFVHKTLENNFGFWNQEQGLALLERPVPCGDASFPCPSDPFTGDVLDLVRVPDDVSREGDAFIDTFPDPDYAYDTLQFAVDLRPRGSVWLQGRFDYQWRNELRENFIALGTGITDPAYLDYFQNHHPSVRNRQKTTTWQGSLLGRTTLAHDVHLAVNVRYQNGYPWAPIHGESIPGSGFQEFYLSDLDEARSDRVLVADVRIDKSFQTSERHRVTAMLDVYNLFNSNAVTNFDVFTGGGFGEVVDALGARAVKIALRWQF